MEYSFKTLLLCCALVLSACHSTAPVTTGTSSAVAEKATIRDAATELLRRDKHSWMRFTAVAGLTKLVYGTLRVMRTIVDAVQVHTAIRQRPVHPFGQCFKLR
jgi:hypothetical protein